MYYCTDCGSKFEYPEVICETLELKEPPYKRIKICPFCKSGEIDELELYHCHCCGARLSEKGEYCSDRCKKAGELLYEAEIKRRKEFLESPLAKAVKEVEEYNAQHKTKHSYGQYFALKDAGGLK